MCIHCDGLILPKFQYSISMIQWLCDGGSLNSLIGLNKSKLYYSKIEKKSIFKLKLYNIFIKYSSKEKIFLHTLGEYMWPPPAIWGEFDGDMWRIKRIDQGATGLNSRWHHLALRPQTASNSVTVVIKHPITPSLDDWKKTVKNFEYMD